MRLIDADELLNDYSVFGMANISREDVRDELYDLIDNQPIAYDIDKVVEELENKCISPNDYPGYVVDLEKAIEIVNQGVR